LFLCNRVVAGESIAAISTELGFDDITCDRVAGEDDFGEMLWEVASSTIGLRGDRSLNSQQKVRG
jgi:hypothetical protein